MPHRAVFKPLYLRNVERKLRSCSWSIFGWVGGRVGGLYTYPVPLQVCTVGVHYPAPTRYTSRSRTLTVDGAVTGCCFDSPAVQHSVLYSGLRKRHLAGKTAEKSRNPLKEQTIVAARVYFPKNSKMLRLLGGPQENAARL